MKSKSVFTRYLLFLCGFLLAGGFYLPFHYNIPFPAPLAAEFEPGIKTETIKGINENRADLVLIGDSVLKEGVDDEELSSLLGVNSYAIPVPGSGTAAWYLVLKNVILKAEHRPKYVAIFFRNTMLTVPQYRTTGKYFPLLDDYATDDEPLLVELAFTSQMNPIEKFSKQYIPWYSARLEIREDLDNLLRYRPASLLIGCNRECTDNAVGSIFGREVDSAALNQMMEDAAETLYAPEEMNFQKQVDESFLPYMIQLAQENDINLIFVRTKILGLEPLELTDYAGSLDSYLLQQEHVFLVDFSRDPRITNEFQIDSLHMNEFGRREFTKILANELQSILEE
ncbi:MAG: hypothetical protein IH589_20120 [Anaerolineales bacterium]|nr:hypothetical protein [Anaerolineales bacterium]